MTTSIARVKSVISGDSVVLLSTIAPAPGQPPLEKVFSLAYVSAPRLRKEGDEVCIFLEVVCFLELSFVDPGLRLALLTCYSHMHSNPEIIFESSLWERRFNSESFTPCRQASVNMG